MAGEKIVPSPRITYPPEQYWDGEGNEYFLCRMYGRQPIIQDSLRVSGRGSTRDEARDAAVAEWVSAYEALRARGGRTR